MDNRNPLLAKYERIPEWVRWIICWPLSVAAGVAGWLLVYSVAGLHEMGEIVPQLAHPVVVQVFFLASLYFTVPRAKTLVVCIFMGLRSLTLPFFVVATLLNVFGIFRLDEVPLDHTWWLQFVAEVLTLVASLVLLFHLRSRLGPPRPPRETSMEEQRPASETGQVETRKGLGNRPDHGIRGRNTIFP